MEKLTGEQIIQKAKEFYDSQVGDFAYGPSKDIAGEVEEVDRTGGEGKGEDWTRTYHFKDHDVYIKVSGWYTSHYGTDFGDWDDAIKEVSPKQKTITVYE